MPGKTLTDIVIAEDDLSTLLSLVLLVGLEDALASSAALTVVAPTNKAFAKLPVDVVAFLTSPEGADELTQILTYHVFANVFSSDKLKDGLKIPTLEGGKVVVSLKGGVFFNDAEAVEVDFFASNGVLHKIDAVLDPNDSR